MIRLALFVDSTRICCLLIGLNFFSANEHTANSSGIHIRSKLMGHVHYDVCSGRGEGGTPKADVVREVT